jgi:hypothetical protein
VLSVSLSTIDEGQPEITVSELRGKETFDRTQTAAIGLTFRIFFQASAAQVPRFGAAAARLRRADDRLDSPNRPADAAV